jgi:hypothetical protein
MAKKGGGGGMPELPDPSQVIRDTGVENMRAGLATTAMNRYNTVTPYGKVSWSRKPAYEQNTTIAPQPVTTTAPTGGGQMVGLYDNNQSNWQWGGDGYENPEVALNSGKYDMREVDGRNVGIYERAMGGTPQAPAPVGTYTDPRTGATRSTGYPVQDGSINSRTLAPGQMAIGRVRDIGRVSDIGVANPVGGASGSPGPVGGIGVTPSEGGVQMSPLDEWTQTIELNPEEQRILDLSRTQKISGGEGVIDAVGRMNNDTFFEGGAGSFSGSNVPELNVNRGGIQRSLNFDPGDARARSEKALYDSMIARLDPRFGEARTNLESDLVNKGIGRGNELWNLENDRFGRTENDAYAQAGREAIIMGGSEVDRLYNQALGSATFANQAQGQDFGQQMGLYDAGLRGQGQQFGQSQAVRQQNNSERMQQYAALSQAMAGQPLNGMPAAPTPPGVSINAADAAGIYGQNIAAQMKQYQADQQANAAKGAGMGQMAGTAGSLAMMGFMCWVAREVYGIENPRWLEFREWMLNSAPAWFRNLYIKHGERFAVWISDKPMLKRVIRMGMDTILRLHLGNKQKEVAA